MLVLPVQNERMYACVLVCVGERILAHVPRVMRPFWNVLTYVSDSHILTYVSDSHILSYVSGSHILTYVSEKMRARVCMYACVRIYGCRLPLACTYTSTHIHTIS